MSLERPPEGHACKFYKRYDVADVGDKKYIVDRTEKKFDEDLGRYKFKRVCLQAGNNAAGNNAAGNVEYLPLRPLREADSLA